MWPPSLQNCAFAGLLAVAACTLLPLETERLSAGVGGYAVMNCHLDFPFGNEIPYHLQWDKDGETIFSWYSGDPAPVVADRWGGRVQRVGGPERGGALGGGSINVSSVRETDAGLYRCRVTFPNRTPPARNNGTFYHLDVEGGNLIVTPPVNATVLEGERAELECLPKSHDWEVHWFKDETPLESLPELAARAERPINGSLILRQAVSTDIGEYMCRVRASDGQTQSSSAFLDVQYKAKVVYAPEERYLPYGKPASLDCHFSANPPLTNLRWEKDGFLFDPYNVPGVFYSRNGSLLFNQTKRLARNGFSGIRTEPCTCVHSERLDVLQYLDSAIAFYAYNLPGVFYSRNGSLLFNQVDESHEGDYSCTPYNALGTEGPSPAVHVRVQRPPSLIARPAPLHLARLGQALTLPCAAATQPHHTPPTIHWSRKDGTELPQGRYSLDGGNLTIADVSEDDRGVYVCTASNEAAAVSVETELLIENVPPRAPYNLTARPLVDAVHLTWQPGHSGVEVDYTVWYRERAVTDWRTMKILSRGVTDATIVGLQPGTEYELRVLAQDHIGDGLFSRPIFTRTLDLEGGGQTAYAAATTPTTDDGTFDDLEVTVRLLDEGALVRWQRAPSDESRCTVRWYQEGLDYRLLATVHTEYDYVFVGKVEEGGRYRARVQCVSGARGGGVLHVPEYTRLRGVAAGAAIAALMLAALAAALYLARRRICARRSRPRPTPPAYPPGDKRHR